MNTIITNKGKACLVEGCNRNAYHKGMCNMHYKRWLRHGDAGEAETRAVSYVVKNGEFKFCQKCKTSKPLSDFPKDANRPDGVFPYCRPCKVHYNHNSIKKHWDAFMVRIKRYWGTPNGKAMRQQAVRNRRAKQGQVSGTDIQILFDAFDNRCAYCGIKGRLSLDHIHPLDLGGVHSIENFAPACSSCNSRKSNKTLEEFIDKESLPSVLDRIQRAQQYVKNFV